MIGLKFGSFDMQAGGCRVTGTDIYSMPENDIQADSLANRDGALITQQRYRSKTITVEGLLRTATRVELEQLRDSFMVAMSQKNQGLDLDYAGSIRRYLASVQNLILTDTSLTTMSFSITFLSPDGVGWDIDSSALLTPTGITTATSLITSSVGGTYMAAPSILLVINTVTGGTGATVTIGNGDTLRVMSVTRDWAAGDRLEIDPLAGTVFVNSLPVDFSGQLPTFAPGPVTVSYSDTFATRDNTISASYAKRWL